MQKNLKKVENFIENTKLKNIHISANNYGMLDENGIPQVIEMTLINPKKFEITDERSKRNYPIEGLDFKNRKIKLLSNLWCSVLLNWSYIYYYKSLLKDVRKL